MSGTVPDADSVKNTQNPSALMALIIVGRRHIRKESMLVISTLEKLK